MKLGTIVSLRTHGKNRNFVRVVAIGRIERVGTSNEFNSKACYDVSDIGRFAGKFYMRPELGTRKHLNVGNSAFWIEEYQIQ